MNNFYTYYNEQFYGAFAGPFCLDERLKVELQFLRDSPFDSLIEYMIILDRGRMRKIFISDFLYKF